MPEPNPTNGELALMLGNLHTKMEDTQVMNEKSFTSILEQTTKTNGRVSFLEKAFWVTSGGLAVVTVIVVPLFLDLIKTKYGR